MVKKKNDQCQTDQNRSLNTFLGGNGGGHMFPKDFFYVGDGRSDN